MELAAQQKAFNKRLASQELYAVGQGKVWNMESAGIEGEAVEEDPDDVELDKAELERLEMEGLNMGEDMGFFYENEGEEVQDDDDIGIGVRVAARR